MKRAESQAGPSGSKRVRKTLFTAEEVLEYFDDFSELDCGNDEDYPASDLESDSDEELDSEGESEPTFRPTQSQTADRRGRGPHEAGDVNIVDGDGWTKIYRENNKQFDNAACGPTNIPIDINETSRAIDFVSLFLDREFWENFVEKT